MKNIITIDPKLRIENLENVFHKPKIIRVSSFDTESVERFDKEISYAHGTGQPVIPVVIDSYGGQMYSCMSMISSILNSKLPVATIVAGKAMSCGAILFAFGTEGFRFMDPHATLMIHDAYQGIHGKVQDLKIDVKHLEATNKSLYKRMAEHLGHSADYFTNLIRKNKHVDWFLDAKEAKRHKLANHLRIPSMESTINVGYIFG